MAAAKKKATPTPTPAKPAPPKEYTYTAQAFGQTFKRRSAEPLSHAVVWRGTRTPFIIWFLDGATAAKRYAAQVAKVFNAETEIVTVKREA